MTEPRMYKRYCAMTMIGNLIQCNLSMLMALHGPLHECQGKTQLLQSTASNRNRCSKGLQLRKLHACTFEIPDDSMIMWLHRPHCVCPHLSFSKLVTLALRPDSFPVSFKWGFFCSKCVVGQIIIPQQHPVLKLVPCALLNRLAGNIQWDILRVRWWFPRSRFQPFFGSIFQDLEKSMKLPFASFSICIQSWVCFSIFSNATSLLLPSRFCSSAVRRKMLNVLRDASGFCPQRKNPQGSAVCCPWKEMKPWKACTYAFSMQHFFVGFFWALVTLKNIVNSSSQVPCRKRTYDEI